MPAKKTAENIATGKRLRSLRLALGFETKQAFANFFGAKHETYSSWENGKNGFPPEQAKKLKERYGITSDWILYGDPKGLPVELYEKVGKAA